MAPDILLVEDNEHHVELTLRALGKLQLDRRVHVARDGLEALQFLFPESEVATDGRRLRLILLDLKMPRVSGLELLERIKNDERTSLIPVVILTSSQDARDMVEGYRRGANSYISKPTGFGKFTETVGLVAQYWLGVNEQPL